MPDPYFLREIMSYNDHDADAMLSYLQEHPTDWASYAAMADRLEEIGHEDAIGYRWCWENKDGPNNRPIKGETFWAAGFLPSWHRLTLEGNHMPGVLGICDDTFQFAIWRISECLRRMKEIESRGYNGRRQHTGQGVTR